MQPEPDRQTATDFAKTFPKIPALQRHMVRCGKTPCRCSRGQLHESWRLIWRDYDGRQRRRYVHRAEVDQVRSIVEDRRAKRDQDRRQLNQALADLKLLSRLYRDFHRTGRYGY
jgi:hypothetical protein